MVGSYIKTKKELKTKVGQPLWTGKFEETSLFGCEIPEGKGKFTCVGPDPYRSRNWFATVHVEDGVIIKVE